MKRIKRPILINRTFRQRIVQNILPVKKQTSHLASVYQEISTRISSLNQIRQNLVFNIEKNPNNASNVRHQLINSIDRILGAFLYEVPQYSTEEAEKLRGLLKMSSGDRKLRNIISQILSIFISFTHLQPTLGIALSINDSQHLFDNKNLFINDNQTSALPSLYRSADSSMDDLTICSCESPTNSNLIEDGEDDENPTVLCRICEKLIPLDLIEKHSTLCMQAHQTKYKIIKYTDKLKKFNKKLSTQLSSHLPGDMKEATTILYPLLFLYLTIDTAISIKGKEYDSKSILDSAVRSLNSIQMPKESSQYSSLFEHGANLIQKKLSNFYEIEQKSREIAQTTVDHSVCNFYKEANISDFEFLSRLSAGAFARVYIAKKVSTGDLYAIKVIKKTFANLKNQIRTVTVERDIMMQLHSPYMVNFYYSFIKKNNLYLVMEYLPGGDIYSLLQSIGSLPEESVRVYIVQVVKALQFLRENQIIHRDLKPDNILIDSNGFLRLTDFGLSLCGINGFQLSTRVGTPDYMAPEIVLPQNYSFSCDYWSLGVMTYEMLYGTPPFHGETEDETFQKILIGSMDLDELEDVSDTCKDFISKLLIMDPMKRLGASRFEEIMEHPWFEGIDWDHVRDMEPVFVPDDQDEKKNMYFLSRYEFPDDAENDIREDLQEQSSSRLSNENSQKVEHDQNQLNVGNNDNRVEHNANQSPVSNNCINNNQPPAEPVPKRSGRKRSSTYNLNPHQNQSEIMGKPSVLNPTESNSQSINNTDTSLKYDSNTNAAKTDESLNFEKVSLQHLKTMNDGASEKIRRKRSSTLNAPQPQNLVVEASKNKPSADPSQNEEKIQLQNFKSLSTLNLSKFKITPQVSSPSLSPRSLNKNLIPQNPHLRPAPMKSVSAPIVPKNVNAESSNINLSPLVSSNNCSQTNVTRPEVKSSNSFSNLKSVLNSSSNSNSTNNNFKQNHRSGSISNMKGNFDSIDDIDTLSSSSPKKTEFEYDEHFTSSFKVDSVNNYNKTDISKRMRNIPIKIPPRYKNSQ